MFRHLSWLPLAASILVSAIPRPALCATPDAADNPDRPAQVQGPDIIYSAASEKWGVLGAMVSSGSGQCAVLHPVPGGYFSYVVATSRRHETAAVMFPIAQPGPPASVDVIFTFDGGAAMTARKGMAGGGMATVPLREGELAPFYAAIAAHRSLVLTAVADGHPPVRAEVNLAGAAGAVRHAQECSSRLADTLRSREKVLDTLY